MIRSTCENHPPDNAQLEHGIHLHNNCPPCAAHSGACPVPCQNPARPPDLRSALVLIRLIYLFMVRMFASSAVVGQARLEWRPAAQPEYSYIAVMRGNARSCLICR